LMHQWIYLILFK